MPNDLVKRAVIRFFFDGARGRGFCATKSVISPIDSDCSYGEKALEWISKTDFCGREKQQ